jgi:hypothetical protein
VTAVEERHRARPPVRRDCSLLETGLHLGVPDTGPRRVDEGCVLDHACGDVGIFGEDVTGGRLLERLAQQRIPAVGHARADREVDFHLSCGPADVRDGARFH